MFKRDEERARKLEARKQRNRESAAASRKRKDDRITHLEQQVAALLRENARLKLDAQVRQQHQHRHHDAGAADLQNAPPASSAPDAFALSSSAGYGTHSANSCTNQLPAVSALLIR